MIGAKRARPSWCVHRGVALVLSMLASATCADARQGRVVETEHIESAVLGREWPYSVYLPADYDTSERAYPVFYLLHGATGDHTNWVQLGGAGITADTLIAKGVIVPVILVMPDGGSWSYWMDSDPETGFGAIETALVDELVPHIDATYRTITTRHGRMIAGLSMGGHGAVRLAFRHPELFGAAAGLSSARVRATLPTQMTPAEIEVETRLFGDRFRERYSAEVPGAYVSNVTGEGAPRMPVYLTVGDDDTEDIVGGNMDLYLLLRRAGVPAELRVTDGAHRWSVWDAGLGQAFLFFDDVFRSRR